MARRYSGWGDQNVSSSNITVIGLTSATTVRPMLYDMFFGTYDTPADVQFLFTLQRYTAAGTNTSFTPIALDPADPAALASIGYNHTAEPTYTANAILLVVPLNLRSTQRWVAAPGSEFKAPATAANGLGWQVIHGSSTVLVKTTMLWEE